eukprot:6453549-Pyramimonas_sp.AAC.1
MAPSAFRSTASSAASTAARSRGAISAIACSRVDSSTCPSIIHLPLSVILWRSKVELGIFPRKFQEKSKRIQGNYLGDSEKKTVFFD